MDEFIKQDFDPNVNSDGAKGEVTEKIERSVIRLPEDPFYLLLMHWYTFIDSKSSYSIFNYIPKEMLPYTVFTFTAGTKALFYSVPDMMKLNGKNNAILIRLIKQMNSLAMSDENASLTKVMDSNSANTPKEEKVSDPSIDLPDDVVSLTTGVADDDENSVIPKEFRTVDIDIDLDDILKTEPIDPKYITVEPSEGKINAPSYDGSIGTKELQDFIKAATADIDNLAKKNIAQDTRLTPLQKQRMNEIANAWKEVKLGDNHLRILLSIHPHLNLSIATMLMLKILRNMVGILPWLSHR